MHNLHTFYTAEACARCLSHAHLRGTSASPDAHLIFIDSNAAQHGSWAIPPASDIR